MKAVFTTIALATVLVATPALAVTGIASAGLSAMRQTNLIVLGDWRTGHDVEGKTFVGGNVTGNSATLGIGNKSQGAAESKRATLTVVGSSKVDNLNINNGSNGGKGNVATNPGVIIKGSSGGINLNAAGATLDIGGNYSGNNNIGSGQTYNIGGNATGSINGTKGATVNAGGAINGNANGATFKSKLGIGFNAESFATLPEQAVQLGADLSALSATLGNLSLAKNPSSITTLGGRAILSAEDGGNGFALFSVDTDFFKKFSEIEYKFATSTLPVIINVYGKTIDYNLNPIGNNQSGNQQVIWNFLEATQISFNRMVNGSVLAVNATVRNNTPIEGSVVAGNFEQGGEVHLGTFSADATFLPEPGTWVQLIAGFGLAGTMMRRRRRLLA